MRVTRRITRLASLLVSIGLLAPLAPARAQDVRVVLATEDRELLVALESALAPWGVLVRTVDDELGATMPGSADRGRAMAEAHGAAAVVWISLTEEGPALWTYDRASDRVASRRLPSAPPFDDATAVAVALSIKTLLRHSTVAPPGERLEVSPPDALSRVRLELGGGARAFATSPADVEPRGSLALSLWPAPAIGLALGARTGSGIGIASSALAGRLLSIDVHGGVRARWAPIPVFDLGLALELGAAIEVLDGTVLTSGRTLTSVEVDPVLTLAAEVGLRPADPIRLGLRVGAQGTPRTRSYLVRGQEVIDTEAVRLVLELVLEVPLDGGTVVSR